eukprot:6434140-Prymnesium_polylepis.1
MLEGLARGVEGCRHVEWSREGSRMSESWEDERERASRGGGGGGGWMKQGWLGCRVCVEGRAGRGAGAGFGAATSDTATRGQEGSGAR